MHGKTSPSTRLKNSASAFSYNAQEGSQSSMRRRQCASSIQGENINSPMYRCGLRHLVVMNAWEDQPQHSNPFGDLGIRAERCQLPHVIALNPRAPDPVLMSRECQSLSKTQGQVRSRWTQCSTPGGTNPRSGLKRADSK